MYNLLPVDGSVGGKLQTVGSGPVAEVSFGWNLSHPRSISLDANKTGVEQAPAPHPALGPSGIPETWFSGIPYPGVNISNPWGIRPGSRTYGALRMANGECVPNTPLFLISILSLSAGRTARKTWTNRGGVGATENFRIRSTIPSWLARTPSPAAAFIVIMLPTLTFELARGWTATALPTLHYIHVLTYYRANLLTLQCAHRTHRT
jgi:hypothetical protein